MKTRIVIMAAATLVAGWIPVCRAEHEEDGGLSDPAMTERNDVVESDMMLPLPPPLPTEHDIITDVLSRFPRKDGDEIIRFVRRYFVDEMREFAKLSMRDREKAMQLLSEVVDEGIILIEARRNDPDKFKKLMIRKTLCDKAMRLARSVRFAEGESRQESIRVLRETLDEEFKVKQELMKNEVAVMEQELDRLKELIHKREASSEMIIGRRLSDLVGETDHLKW